MTQPQAFKIDIEIQASKVNLWAAGGDVSFPDNLDCQSPQFNFAIAIADFLSGYMIRENRCSGYTEKELIQQRIYQKKYRLKHKVDNSLDKVKEI